MNTWGAINNNTQISHLKVNILKIIHAFNYMGSTLAEDGELYAEVTHRVQGGWKNWKIVAVVLRTREMCTEQW